MTYRTLLKTLLQAENCQLDQDVTVHVGSDEFFAVGETCTSEDDDPADGILDPGHLYLRLRNDIYQ